MEICEKIYKTPLKVLCHPSAGRHGNTFSFCSAQALQNFPNHTLTSWISSSFQQDFRSCGFSVTLCIWKNCILIALARLSAAKSLCVADCTSFHRSPPFPKQLYWWGKNRRGEHTWLPTVAALSLVRAAPCYAHSASTAGKLMMMAISALGLGGGGE